MYLHDNKEIFSLHMYLYLSEMAAYDRCRPPISSVTVCWVILSPVSSVFVIAVLVYRHSYTNWNSLRVQVHCSCSLCCLIRPSTCCSFRWNVKWNPAVVSLNSRRMILLRGSSHQTGLSLITFHCSFYINLWWSSIFPDYWFDCYV